MALSFLQFTNQLLCYYIIYNVSLRVVHSADTNSTSNSNCGELSFTPNIVTMFMYIVVVSGAAYCHGRHRGEYIRETSIFHKLFMWFISYILLYIITLCWLYYNFFHEEEDINYIGEHFPWLTLYGIAYVLYAIISTFSFAYHSNYDNAALIQFVCLLCTILPLALAIVTFFLFQTSQDIKEYKSGLFDRNNTVLICFNIDLLSMVLTCLLLIAFVHHIYVLCRVLLSFLRDTNQYLSHPYSHRGKGSDLTRSTTASERKKSKQYMYKSADEEDSETDHDEEAIVVDVEMPQSRSNNMNLCVPTHAGENEESIELNQSYDVKRAIPGSVSYDI